MLRLVPAGTDEASGELVASGVPSAAATAQELRLSAAPVPSSAWRKARRCMMPGFGAAGRAPEGRVAEISEKARLDKEGSLRGQVNAAEGMPDPAPQGGSEQAWNPNKSGDGCGEVPRHKWTRLKVTRSDRAERDQRQQKVRPTRIRSMTRRLVRPSCRGGSARDGAAVGKPRR